MLHTPAAFTPLIRPQEHADTLTFVFHRGQLLLRNATLGLPEQEVLGALQVPLLNKYAANPAE